MHAKITAHKGWLVCQLVATTKDVGAASTLDNPSPFGQLVHDTGKNLGVSAEALQLLRSLSSNGGNQGDIDWTRTKDGKTLFGWQGGPVTAKEARLCFTSYNFEVLDHVEIPNEVPARAKEFIDCQ